MPAAADDELYLRRAIRLAMNGRGLVEPNPMVGCVLVKDGQVVGEGYHAQFGGPHAEPSALADCRERGNSPEGATAYVTLEPCCHTNKKTPPCTPLVIESGVARVVIGCLDPNPAVNGNGVTMLRAAGIEVTTGVCEGEAKQLIEPFLRSVDHNSYLTLKWAQSADGKVAGPGGKRTRISGPESSRLVHQLRARAEAIVIGIGTAMIDDPMLTPRDVPLRRKLLRIVLDPRLRLPLTSKLVTTAGEWPTAVIYDERHPNRRRVEELRAKGVAVHGYEGFGDRNPSDAADTLQLIREELHVHDLFMEPGPTLAGSYLSFTDRLWVFRSPMRIDDPTAPTATGIPLHLLPTRTIRVGDDELTEYRRLMIDEQTDQPYAVTPSADLVLASAARDRR